MSNKYSVCVALICLFAVSCSDFLKEDNKTGDTANLVYNTATGIDGLVHSAYSYCRGFWG